MEQNSNDVDIQKVDDTPKKFFKRLDSNYRIDFEYRKDPHKDYLQGDIFLFYRDNLITTYLKAHTLGFTARIANSKKFFITSSSDYTVKLFVIDTVNSAHQHQPVVPTMNDQANNDTPICDNGNRVIRVIRANARMNLKQRMMEFCLTPDDKYIIGYHYYDNSFSVIKIDYDQESGNYQLILKKRLTPEIPFTGFDNCRVKKSGDVFFYNKRGDICIISHILGPDPTFYAGRKYKHKARLDEVQTRTRKSSIRDKIGSLFVKQ